jgi:hypothetical protein
MTRENLQTQVPAKRDGKSRIGFLWEKGSESLRNLALHLCHIHLHLRT